MEMFTAESAVVPGLPDLSEAIAGMFTKVGVETTVTRLDTGTFNAKLTSRTHTGDMGPIGGVGAVSLDPQLFLEIVCGTGKGYAYKVSNAELDTTVASAAGEIDAAKRKALLEKAFRLIYDQQLAIGAVEVGASFGAGPKVKSYKPYTAMSYPIELETVVLNG